MPSVPASRVIAVPLSDVARPGDHVDHGEERAVAVERRGGPADDLHALEVGRVEPELGADLRLAEHVVVDAVAVDEQQDPAVVVARLAEAARADEAEVAIVGDVDPADAAQNVGQRPVAVAVDLLRGDERHRGRRFDRGLQPLGRAKDLARVDLHQILEAEVGQRLRPRPKAARRAGRRARDAPTLLKKCLVVIGRPLSACSSGVMGSVIGPRHDEQLRADLEPSPLGGFVVDAETQLAVFEEELRHAAGRGEPFDVADREHGRIPQFADDVRRLANWHPGDVEDPAPALRAPPRPPA